MANFESEGSASEKKLNESNNSIGGENSQDSQEEVENIRADEEQKEKLVKLPLGRIKTIIKMDPEVNMINQEAVFLITKSTVYFAARERRFMQVDNLDRFLTTSEITLYIFITIHKPEQNRNVLESKSGFHEKNGCQKNGSLSVYPRNEVRNDKQMVTYSSRQKPIHKCFLLRKEVYL
nr:PREDICTED: DNA polymerase epsilon subunit C isoform X1 [Megachile rotundata]